MSTDTAQPDETLTDLLDEYGDAHLEYQTAGDGSRFEAESKQRREDAAAAIGALFERLSGELETARAALAQPTRVVVVLDKRRGRVYSITGSNEEAQQHVRELVAKYDGDPNAATMTAWALDPQAAPAVVSGTSQAAADDEPFDCAPECRCGAGAAAGTQDGGASRG